MSVGLPVSKEEIDSRCGDIARAFQKLSGDVATMQGFYAKTSDADLVAYGYTSDEVATQKTAFNDAALLMVRIFSGTEALAAPKDFRTFLQRLWGVGSF